MNFIDAHVHVWTDDTGHYPLGKGWKKEEMSPRRFTPEDLFKHTRPAGVDRINLIQMSYYGFENCYQPFSLRCGALPLFRADSV